jgi:hypothetical protein
MQTGKIDSESGWTILVSKFHEKFKEAMIPYRNHILDNSEIRTIINENPHFKDDF